MADRTVDRRSHIVIVGTARAEGFTSPSAGGPKFRTKRVNRAAHGGALKRQLERVEEELAKRRQDGVPAGVEAPGGFYLEFESPPGFSLKLESLENAIKGIELCSTRPHEQGEIATVFIPEGMLSFFIKRVEDYLTKLDNRSGAPRHRSLIESIARMRLAVAESFWTEPQELLPPANISMWWEAWLRGDDPEVVKRFLKVAAAAEIKVSDERQTFPDRTVVLICCSLSQISASLEFLDVLAELRRVKQIGSLFMRIGHQDRVAWQRDLAARVRAPGQDAVAVTILDSGVYRAHPLLSPLLSEEDCHVYKSAWKLEDKEGHGSGMAGIAVYGDLAAALVSSGPLEISHRLESVKVKPPQGSNPSHLYGSITIDAVSRVEIQAPTRPRVFSMALTADAADQGLPTSWSSELDNLSSGAGEGDDDTRRLFFVSAGNIQAPVVNYPHQNALESIQDPGQSWNAVTVGAYTDLTEIDDPHFDGWACVAPPGGLSPASTTSVLWQPTWPIKPDIVMEGGNHAISSSGTQTDSPDSLSLLTTHHNDLRPFAMTGDTSAATAAAARFAAIIRAQYPVLWPETIRTLLVDSADWTPHMRKELDSAHEKKQVEISLRHFGFGVPNLERALWSAGNSLTLIAQDSLQPFTKGRSKEMNLHALPWPRAELQMLGSTEVELRVSLSYFIEPSPARRGWKKRHRYASHALRFAVQKPAESVPALRKRVNKDAREEDEKVHRIGDSEGWLLGRNLRSKGSLHHDRWTGTASELARREHIAVYPALGWWRERPSLGRSESRARYALVVSIRTPPTSVDIYQPVAIQLGIAVPTKI